MRSMFGSLSDMFSRRREAKRLDAMLDSARAEADRTIDALRSVGLDPEDTAVAIRVWDRVSGEVTRSSLKATQVERSGWSLRRNRSILAIAVVGSLGGASYVATRALSPRVDQAQPSVRPSVSNDPFEEQSVPPLASESSSPDSQDQDLSPVQQARMERERKQAHQEYRSGVAEAQRERDEDLADLAEEEAGVRSEYATEKRGIDREYGSEMRELEEEWEEADPEDRKEIEREMRELRAEWDLALGDLKSELNEDLAEVATEREGVLREYAQTLDELERELQDALAEIKRRYDED
jgi:hypothetical protein